MKLIQASGTPRIARANLSREDVVTAANHDCITSFRSIRGKIDSRPWMVLRPGPLSLPLTAYKIFFTLLRYAFIPNAKHGDDRTERRQ